MRLSSIADSFDDAMEKRDGTAIEAQNGAKTLGATETADRVDGTSLIRKALVLPLQQVRV